MHTRKVITNVTYYCKQMLCPSKRGSGVEVKVRGSSLTLYDSSRKSFRSMGHQFVKFVSNDFFLNLYDESLVTTHCVYKVIKYIMS